MSTVVLTTNFPLCHNTKFKKRYKLLMVRDRYLNSISKPDLLAQ